VARVPTSGASASSNPGDVVLLGTPRGDDEVRQTMASKVVVVARSIGWRRCAEGWPELAGAAACVRVILASVCAFCYRGLRRGERRGGYLQRG
jgi:hypothetical protein